MSGDSTGVEQASERLGRALETLEVAVARQVTARRSQGELRHEIETLSDDRSRLAHELDQAKGEAARLREAAGEADRRVDGAIGTIRDLLGDL